MKVGQGSNYNERQLIETNIEEAEHLIAYSFYAENPFDGAIPPPVWRVPSNPSNFQYIVKYG